MSAANGRRGDDAILQ